VTDSHERSILMDVTETRDKVAPIHHENAKARPRSDEDGLGRRTAQEREGVAAENAGPGRYLPSTET
jgi:hypothetical protein